MVYKLTLGIFLSLCLVTSEAFAQPEQSDQAGGGTEEAGTTKSDQPKKSSPSLTPKELQAQKELEEIKSRPEEYRVLLLGVQIFLGRFGYGIGPYTGKLDEKTQAGLRAYQKDVGLPETGEADYRTLQHLTADNQILDQPLPYLPKSTFHFEQWDKAIQVQGTWAAEGALTDDAVQTSRIFCFREEKQCIESTAVLIYRNVPVLEVLTNIYSIKEWDEEQLVSAPYDGEPCTISILRMNRKQKSVTRFVAYQQKEGICKNVKAEDVQFRLVNGPEVFATLKRDKAKATKRILRVEE